MLNDFQLKDKNKVYRMAISPKQNQIVITCGGWASSSGISLLYDLGSY